MTKSCLWGSLQLLVCIVWSLSTVQETQLSAPWAIWHIKRSFQKTFEPFPSRRTKEMKFVVFGKLLEACDWAALIGTEVNLLEGFYQRKFCLCEIFTRILCTQNSERSKSFDFYELKLLVIKTVRSQSLLLCLVNCFCREHCTLLRLIFKIILIPYWKLIQSKY